MEDIADVIMCDPALAGRLLRYVNSPLVGAAREVTTIRDAVILLGLRTVKLTALGFSLASPDLRPRCPGFRLKEFWSRSFMRASAARRIATVVSDVRREEAFTAGLLARIGCLALASSVPERYGRVLEAVEAGVPLIQAERCVLGVDHAAFGGRLLADWDIPDVLVRAVRQQYEFTESNAGQSPDDVLGRVVGIANGVMPLFVPHEDASDEDRARSRRLIEHDLGLDKYAWRRVSEDILQDYEQAAEVFEIELGSSATAMNLFDEAREQATRVAMAAELERSRSRRERTLLLRRATTDPLTGLANRAAFDVRLARALRAVGTGGGHCALILFDVDRFKRFNDRYGHPVGDAALRHVAACLRSVLRGTDLPARYGGEEFAVVVSQTDQQAACIVAARIRKQIAETWLEIAGRRLRVTISVGLAITSDYRSPPSAEQLIADADTQLYISKRAGRNTWSYFNRAASVALRIRSAS